MSTRETLRDDQRGIGQLDGAYDAGLASLEVARRRSELPSSRTSSNRDRRNIETTDLSAGEETDASMAEAPRVRLVSVDTAAQILGIGRTTVYDLVNRGLLRSLKIGRRTLLPVEDIDAFVDRRLAST